jgi:hypothetical protein
MNRYSTLRLAPFGFAGNGKLPPPCTRPSHDFTRRLQGDALKRRCVLAEVPRTKCDHPAPGRVLTAGVFSSSCCASAFASSRQKSSASLDLIESAFISARRSLARIGPPEAGEDLGLGEAPAQAPRETAAGDAEHRFDLRSLARPAPSRHLEQDLAQNLASRLSLSLQMASAASTAADPVAAAQATGRP